MIRLLAEHASRHQIVYLKNCPPRENGVLKVASSGIHLTPDTSNPNIGGDPGDFRHMYSSDKLLEYCIVYTIVCARSERTSIGKEGESPFPFILISA